MRVVIAEDDALLRDGLAMLLSGEGIDVVGTVPDPAGLTDLLAGRAPTEVMDAAVLDVRMPPTFTTEGLAAALDLRRASPGFPVLVLSAYVEQEYASRLLADGASGVGYLLKERVARVDDVIDALHRVAGGGTAMDPEVVSQLMSRRTAADPVRSLTPREYEVLGLIAQGLGNAEIGRRLVVTEQAVSKHIGNIFAKLGLSPSDSGHRRVLAALAYLRS